MQKMKKIAAVTIATGGLVLAGAGTALATGPGADANGLALNSPGVASGNVIQLPVHIPVNLCGNSISVIGLLNPAFGAPCVNS